MTLADIGEYARSALQAVNGISGDRHDARAAGLLKRINAVVMVFDNRLYDLRQGSWVSIETASDHKGLSLPAAALADAAARLLNTDAAPSLAKTAVSRGAPRTVLLLLPPAEFLPTPVNFPGLAAGAVKAAMQLQASTMLPAWDEELNIALATGERDQQKTDVALCLPTKRLDRLFDCFIAENLFLTAVLPRPLILGADQLVLDQDSHNVSQVLMQSGTLYQYLHSTKWDLDSSQLADSWQQETEVPPELKTDTTAMPPLSLHSAEDYLAALKNQENTFNTLSAYAMCPAAALAARHQLDRGKRLWQAAAVLAAIGLLSALPFLVQTLQIASLESRLQVQRELATPARQDQAQVRDFETEWGIMLEFPRQNIADVMLILQDVIRPSVLTALEIDDGYISIEGESSDPENLLQQLEQSPLFTEVDFARATSNNRYYIDLRLTTVNYPAWRDWYFPERR